MLDQDGGLQLYVSDGDEEYDRTLAVKMADGKYYLACIWELEEEEKGMENITIGYSGTVKAADFDKDGTEEVAVAAECRVDSDGRLYADITRLFILEPEGSGWKSYEYPIEEAVQDWKALLPASMLADDKAGTRYDKIGGFDLSKEDKSGEYKESREPFYISFWTLPAVWSDEWGYTGPDGGILSWLSFQVEYRGNGEFSTGGPYAYDESAQKILEEFKAME